MNKEITMPSPPSAWEDLNKEQLVFIHSLNRAEMPPFIFKTRVFLELCGLELCGKSYYEEPSSEKADIASIEKQVQWIEDMLNNKLPATIVLRKKGDKDEKEPLMAISSKNLFEAIDYFTEFLDNPFTLIDCKIDSIQIGQHTYAGPDPMLLSLTYEQYQNAQSALTGIAFIQDSLRRKNESVLKKIQSSFIDVSKASEQEITTLIGASNIEEMKKEELSLKESQGDFLAAVLCLKEIKETEYEQYDSRGRLVTDAEGMPIRKKTSFWQRRKYDGEEMQRLRDELIEFAPTWLFPLLYQWFQSSLIALQGKFPKLFRDNKAAGEENDPVKAFAQTLNTIMKEQGFSSQRDVLSTEAVLNFETLNRLATQAEELERINKKNR